MLRSCLILLVAYGLLVAAYSWWVGQMFDPPGQYIGGAVAALLVGGCLGSLYNARVASREAALVAAARAGLPPSDGRWTAVAGQLQPLGEALTAPFSGQPCVLCEYEVASQHRIAQASRTENSRPGADFTGFLMNPCAVRGDAGEMRLLGFPNLVGFGERVCDSTAAAANARNFFASTEFENLSGLKLLTVFSAIKAAWSDDDGLVRKNLRLGKTLPADLFPDLNSQDADGPPTAAMPTEQSAAGESDADEDDEDDDEEIVDEDFDEELDTDVLDDNLEQTRRNMPLLKEKRVKVGEEVCAIGIYSGQRQGLVPGGWGADHFITLMRGRAADIERRARASVRARILGGLIGLLIIHAVIYSVMFAARHDSRQQSDREQEARRIVDNRDGDAGRLKTLLGRGVDVNARDSLGRTLLMEAAARGNAAAAQTLVEAGADVNLRGGEGQSTALSLALGADHPEVVELLRRAGAAEDAATPERP